MSEFLAKALLFDLDGVLVDSTAVVERTWCRWAQRHRLDSASLLQVAHGRRTRDTLEAVTPHLDLDREVAWLDAAELEDLDGIVEIPGARQLLVALPATMWAVVTSCGRTLAQRRLQTAGLPVPGVLVTSEDVQKGKPAPDGYRLAARELGCAPESCLVFEDAPAGIAAGRASGARVVGVATTHERSDLSGAEAVVPDLMGIVVRSDGAVLRVDIV